MFSSSFYVLHYTSLYYCIIIEEAFVWFQIIDLINFNVIVYISALCTFQLPYLRIDYTLFLNSFTVSLTFAKCQKYDSRIENYQSKILNFLFEI